MPLVLPPFTLAGRSVTLRPLTHDDVPLLAAASSESREHYGYSHVPDGPDGALVYVERALRARDCGERIPFAIVFEGRVVGTTSYSDFQPWTWPEGSPMQRTDRPDAVEIGSTWLGSSAQRTRCNTEAKYLLLCHAFDVWGVHRVALRTDERNARSRRAIERLGARLDGIRRADTSGVDGSVRNSAYYSLLRDEWPGARVQLERRLESR
jgi:RimJ/RimL family protein N-acetyltransferase